MFARPALILRRPTAGGSVLVFAAVFTKHRKLGREVALRTGVAAPSLPPDPTWSSLNSATKPRRLNITKQ